MNLVFLAFEDEASKFVSVLQNLLDLACQLKLLAGVFKYVIYDLVLKAPLEQLLMLDGVLLAG